MRPRETFVVVHLSCEVASALLLLVVLRFIVGVHGTQISALSLPRYSVLRTSSFLWTSLRCFFRKTEPYRCVFCSFLAVQAQDAGSVQQFDKALKLYNQVRCATALSCDRSWIPAGSVEVQQ